MKQSSFVRCTNVKSVEPNENSVIFQHYASSISVLALGSNRLKQARSGNTYSVNVKVVRGPGIAHCKVLTRCHDNHEYDYSLALLTKRIPRSVLKC